MSVESRMLPESASDGLDGQQNTSGSLGTCKVRPGDSMGCGWGAEHLCVGNKQELEGKEVRAGSETREDHRAWRDQGRALAPKEQTARNPGGGDIPGPVKIAVKLHLTLFSVFSCCESSLLSCSRGLHQCLCPW